MSVIEGEPYHLEATFHDTEALPTKQPVLVRGVPVGKVTAVDYLHGTVKARVTFTVDDNYGPSTRTPRSRSASAPCSATRT